MTNINNNKAALVTGASHGIGLELAKILLGDGWVVYGTGRDVSSLEDTKALYLILPQKNGHPTKQLV